MNRTERLAARRRRTRLSFGAFVTALAVVTLGAAAWRFDLFDIGRSAEPAARNPGPSGVGASPPSPVPGPTVTPEPLTGAGPINTAFAGLTTFRGNATRTYYGEGPVPAKPKVLWRYPSFGGLCSNSSADGETKLWCGTGWTGQPNVVETENEIEVRFGAYDRGVHILDGLDGRPLKDTFLTGDIIKGTVTSDPDGYPLLYTGSRDNDFRILALDRGPAMEELWSLSADSAPNQVWNNDWDGSALVIDDHLLIGGENSWFYAVKLDRGYDQQGKVTVSPEIRMLVPGYDDELFAELGDQEVSIENSPAYHDGVVYFANSGGLVQGWDISGVVSGGKKYERVFRFWTGEDTDASVVIDDEGYLYVASELERHNARGAEVGQLMKLDPSSPDDPLVWSKQVPGDGGDGGLWATPGLYKDALFATTNTGRLLAIDRVTGKKRWEIDLPPPTWTSPVVVDDVLIVGDCSGVLHAYDVSEPFRKPTKALWKVKLDGCIESTPAVWKGMVYVGARGGAMYGIGDPI
ncbi:MAG TPA: PQQ-binding-like beta-propeller repeat protein [Actinomycetota bacterium]|nr:PQQ-binding-like beta-propeller repeat protein [Actinomycetota bacterium]